MKEALDKNYYEGQIKQLQHQIRLQELKKEQRKELALTLLVGSYIIILTILTML